MSSRIANELIYRYTISATLRIIGADDTFEEEESSVSLLWTALRQGRQKPMISSCREDGKHTLAKGDNQSGRNR